MTLLHFSSSKGKKANTPRTHALPPPAAFRSPSPAASARMMPSISSIAPSDEIERTKPVPISVPHPPPVMSLLDQKPESVVAETLKMKGELQFNRLLRVDGRFEGDLITNKGSLVVGPTGEVVGDLKNMEEVYVEGIVRGNVCARTVKIKKNGVMLGDIMCMSLTLDPTACIKGIADTASLKERANNATPSTNTSAAPAPSPASSAMSANPVTSPPVADLETPPPDTLEKLKDADGPVTAPSSTV